MASSKEKLAIYFSDTVSEYKKKSLKSAKKKKKHQ